MRSCAVKNEVRKGEREVVDVFPEGIHSFIN